MTTAAKRAPCNGEGKATYEAVLEYLLANYRVCRSKAEAAMEKPWAIELRARGLMEWWAAWEVGDKLAWRLKWRYLGDGR